MPSVEPCLPIEPDGGTDYLFSIAVPAPREAPFEG